MADVEKLSDFRRWLQAKMGERSPIGHIAYDAFAGECCLYSMRTFGKFLGHLKRVHDTDRFFPPVQALISAWNIEFSDRVLGSTDALTPKLLSFFIEGDEGYPSTWFAWCPYCDDWHEHPEDSAPINAAMCVREDSPFIRSGYIFKRSLKHFLDFKRSSKKESRRKSISPKLRFFILKRDGFACQYCGKRAPHSELEVDHKMPASKNGDSDPLNLVTACAICNIGKGAKTI